MSRIETARVAPSNHTASLVALDLAVSGLDAILCPMKSKAAAAVVAAVVVPTKAFEGEVSCLWYAGLEWNETGNGSEAAAA